MIIKHFISVFSILSFVACSSNNDKKNNCNLETEINSKKTEMESKALYPDSLTPVQRKCIEKANSFLFNPKYADASYSVWEAGDYLTEEEKDAISELSIWDLKKRYKSIDDSVFNSRFYEIFGYNFDIFSNFFNSDKCMHPIDGEKYTENLIHLSPTNSRKDFYISRKIKMIIDGFSFGIEFDNAYDISSFMPASRFESGVQLGTPDNSNYVSSTDYIFHLNNYLFNEANASRTWLLIKDKYFMSHLLIQYGYDGDKEINKMVLKEYRKNDTEIIDMPVEAFHVYPDGKVKILDGLLKAAAEMSTAECADYFEWATDVVYVLNGADDSSDKSRRVKYLTVPQKLEIIAHIVDHMLPVYDEYLGTNHKYGTTDLDFGDLRIISCFWSSVMRDHDLISEIEKNNYYGLTNLESLVLAMKDFELFYNEETGVFEPWNYVPMRYRNAGE